MPCPPLPCRSRSPAPPSPPTCTQPGRGRTVGGSRRCAHLEMKKENKCNSSIYQILFICSNCHIWATITSSTRPMLAFMIFPHNIHDTLPPPFTGIVSRDRKDFFSFPLHIHVSLRDPFWRSPPPPPISRIPKEP